MSRPTLTLAIEQQMLARLAAEPDEHIVMVPAAYNAQGQVMVHRDNLSGVRAQRHLYRLVIGPLERADYLRKVCDRAGCLNPHHYAKTRRASRRTACPKGHPYTPENTLPDGRSRCRTCRDARLARNRKGDGLSPAQINAAKTHCIHGHELTDENTYVRKNKRTGALSRQCRTCAIERALDRYYEQKEAS